MELKNPTDENATLRAAFNQLQTYKEQIPSLFQYNEILAITDGLEARAGTITSGWEWFLPWKTIDGKRLAKETTPQLEVMLKGIFEKRRFLDIARNFIVFEKDRKETAKKMAAYHQYHAVNKAVEATLKAASPKGDKRCGVVWHTQGSGRACPWYSTRESSSRQWTTRQ